MNDIITSLLRDAFEAGENRGRFVMKEGDNSIFHSDYPTFDQWIEKRNDAVKRFNENFAKGTKPEIKAK